MSKPTIKANGANTYHRDGTVSHWDVYACQWERKHCQCISDRVLASMSDAERRRIDRMRSKPTGGAR